MNLLPKSHKEFSEKEYWNKFFKKRGNKAFEWYGEYPELYEYLHKYIKVNNCILIIGCGNSNLSSDMYDFGMKNITNIDISQVVIRQMQKVNSEIRPDMKFLHMDATKMVFDDDSFNTILDKGTLDALMPDETPQTLETIDRLFSEIDRVTKIGGNYICITLLQEHILRKLLAYFPNSNWTFRAIRCHEIEEKTAEDEQIVFPVFAVVCTKFKLLNKAILEVMEGSKTTRYETTDLVIDCIKYIQQNTLVYRSLNKTGNSALQDASIELYKPDCNSPRYTIYVVDYGTCRQKSPYAAFIVPQGRETEWLFSTKQGRQNLLKTANYNRFAVVIMHRGQIYESLEEVKAELNEHIINLAPPGMKKSIPYLSLGNDVGKREIRCEGKSDISGPFVIEDVTGENNEVFRRLIFLESQNIVQSEAKLKNVRVRGGKSKMVVDTTYLACQHHIYMSLGVHMACRDGKGQIAVIGLGGGGLCTFLNQLHPQLTITAIDIDPEMVKIATDWFGLVEKDNFKVQIKDGLDFIKEAAENNSKLNAVLFDVDSKDSSLGLSCPPKAFLDTEVLQAVKKCIGDEGIFVLNLVIRDAELRASVHETLKEEFSNIISYKLKEDLNDIIFCSNCSSVLKNHVKKSTNDLNSLVRKKKIQVTDLIDVNALMESLKII